MIPSIEGIQSEYLLKLVKGT
uniref:Uncharacterized protein n=1 Tax=Rhizophora mucronata TaxID=61149 RepID=A0A2P2JXL6_RHIMU